MLDELTYFIHERERVRLRKLAGHKPPWTDDPIIGSFRFCNVNREHDAVTMWIADNLRSPRPHLWFVLVVARLMNQPSTLARIYPGKDGAWDAKAFLAATDPDVHPKPIFNAAYIVSTNGVTMQKNKYIAERVLAPLWRARATRPLEVMANCDEWAEWLMQANGISDFIANQVVTDYKYTYLCEQADDWETFCLAGPGTQRGLNRLHGRPTGQNLPRAQSRQELLDLRAALVQRGKAIHMRDLNNLSNCLCEFDKWMRAVLAEGKPKQRYTP